MIKFTKIMSVIAVIPLLMAGFSIAAAASDKSYQAVVQAAIDNPLREEGDRKRDAGRKPAEVVEFMGIKPGMTVLDMLSGAGYYAEILSSVVGVDGKVIALNNKGYMDFTKGAIAKRIEQPGRMDNVTLKIAEINEMELGEGIADAVFLTLSYHDFYYVDEKGGWPEVDVTRTLDQLHHVLKTGGILAIIDHSAVKGAPLEVGTSLHRIDPEIVKKELAAVGFELEAESDILGNPADDMTKSIWGKDIRGKTNRFAYRFIKK